MTGRPQLREVQLPDFGMPDAMPEIPAATYAARTERLRERAEREGYDRLVVYADREHSANLSYLTGFDPRFEEALLVVGPDGDPAVLVGNECYGMAGAAPVQMRRHRFQDFSLPGQPRDRSRPLSEILGEEGIGPGSRVGVVGWKTYAQPGKSDLPAYLVDELRGLAGQGGTVENATDILIDAADGLRVINEVEQLAAFEWASCHTQPGRQAAAARAATGHDRVPGGGAARVERLATVLPPDAHRRRTCQPWSAQPGRSPDRARGSVHHSLRHLGRTHLPGRVRGRVGGRAGRADPRLRRSAGGTVLRGHRRVVRCDACRSDGRRTARDHRAPPGRPVLRHLPQPGSPDPPGRMGQLARSPPNRRSSCAPGWPSRSTSSRPPARTTSRRTSRTASPLPTHRCEPPSPSDIPTRGPASSVAGGTWHDQLGIELHPDVLPFSNMPAHLPPFLLRPDRAMTLA